MADEREPEEGGELPGHVGAGAVRGSAEPVEPGPEEARVRAEREEELLEEGGGVPAFDAPNQAETPWEPPLPEASPGPERVPKEEDPGPDA